MKILPLHNEFLNQYSKKTRYSYNAWLRTFLEYCQEKKIHSIEEVTKADIRQWAKEKVEPQDFRKATKEKYYMTIRSYFKYLRDVQYLPRDHFSLYLKTKLGIFTDYIQNFVQERNNLYQVSLQDAIDILNHAKHVNRRMFIYLALNTMNGFRDSEIISIRLENIREFDGYFKDPDSGKFKPIRFMYFSSGVIEEHKKEGQVFGFVPKKLHQSQIWQDYLADLYYQYHDTPEFLFQTNSQDGFITNKSTYRNIKKYAKAMGKTKTYWATHIFRGMLTDYRLRENCPEALREILVNHSPKGTNAKYYLKRCKKLQNRYLYWKKYTPDLLRSVPLVPATELKYHTFTESKSIEIENQK